MYFYQITADTDLSIVILYGNNLTPVNRKEHCVNLHEQTNQKIIL